MDSAQKDACMVSRENDSSLSSFQKQSPALSALTSVFHLEIIHDSFIIDLSIPESSLSP